MVNLSNGSLLRSATLEARAKEDVTDDRKHDRAGDDRHWRAGPFRDKAGLHPAELTQSAAGQTIEPGNPAAERLVDAQLNRSVEVIKVVDYTDIPVYMKEILFVKISNCSKEDKEEIFRISTVFGLTVTDYDKNKLRNAARNDVYERFNFDNRIDDIKNMLDRL